jgi:copper chaperone CopZ
VFSPIAALLTGFIGGGIVAAVDDREEDRGKTAAPAEPAVKAACTDGCCTPKPAARGNPWLGALHYGFVTLPGDIAKMLLLGIAIAAAISLLVPDNYFAGSAIAGFPGMLLMMAIGIPIYVCSTASVPLAAAFVAAGFSPGAALVFLLTGPSTNAATITTLWKVLGRRTTLIYLGTLMGGALLSGLALNGIIGATQTAGTVCVQCHELAWWNTASAIALLALLAYSLLPRRPHGIPEDLMSEETTTLNISGMNCSHCAESVRRALAGQPGVEQVAVDLAGGKATVSGSGFALPALVAAVESLGYSAQPG